jgi:hypothetical protein
VAGSRVWTGLRAFRSDANPMAPRSEALKFAVPANLTASAITECEIMRVCTENSVRIDLVTESPNVRDDGRAVVLLPDAARLADQVEEPT